MKATELLKSQHDEVAELFKKIEKTEADKERRRLFHELGHKLVAHDAIEREIFYPACEKEMGLIDALGEALVEHGVVEFSLYVAARGLDKDDFEHRMTVLREMVEHHVEEEEGTFFPKVERALGDALLEKLGEQMEARFQVAVAEGYTEPLRNQLNQVLAGALETKAPPAAKKAKKAAPAHNGARTASPR